MKSAVSVLVPYPVDKAYDYALPVGMQVAAGAPWWLRIVPVGQATV